MLAAMTAILFSCNKGKNNGTTFSNDMDNVKMWNNPANVVKGIAHSGNYSCKLDTANIYSFGFNTLLGDALTQMPKKINVSLWVYSLISNPASSLVVEINNNGQQIFWKNADFKTTVSKTKDWTEIKASFDLPTNLNPKDELKIYVWNPKKQELYVDDFNISFE